jgi:hypothetical protein
MTVLPKLASMQGKKDEAPNKELAKYLVQKKCCRDKGSGGKFVE